jgi:hypothetical protein
MDELKQYIQSQRDGLDVDSPDPQGWNRLKNELRPRGTAVPLYKMLAAACIVFLLGVGAYLFYDGSQGIIDRGVAKGESPTMIPPTVIYKGDSPQVIRPLPISPLLAAKRTVKTQPGATTFAKGKESKNNQGIVDPPGQTANSFFANAEKEYGNLIAMQVKVIEATPIYIENENYFISFKQQFASISQVEKNLKSEIAAEGFTSDMVKKMISLYTQKLKLLFELQEEIDKVNSKKKMVGVDSTTAMHHIKL